VGRLLCMSTDTTPHSQAQSLHLVHLRVGLPVQRGDKTIHYKTVRLREVSVADERWAVRQAERVVLWQGEPRLVVSDADFKLALTTRHIEAFVCDGAEILLDEIDMSTMERLKPVDLAAIESRVFVLELALKVRYGEISQAMFDTYMAGVSPQEQAAPQPVGPAADAGADARAAGSGPFVLPEQLG
jgi:phage FluMu protein gp41